MERNYNVSGADRKRLVKTIGDALGIRPKYMGTPSFAFQIGSYEVSKHGVLIFEKDEQTANVLAAIKAAGFMAEQTEGNVLIDRNKEDAEETLQEEGTQITEGKILRHCIGKFGCLTQKQRESHQGSFWHRGCELYADRGADYFRMVSRNPHPGSVSRLR